MKRKTQGLKWQAMGLWLGAMALSGVWGCQGLSCSGPGYEVAADDRFTPPQVIDPALELTLTREGGDFVEAEGLKLVQTLLGFDGGDGWVDVSGFVNDYLSREPLTFFNVSARELVMAVKLPNPQGLKVTFLDGPPRVRVEIDQLWVRVEATVVDGNTRSACRIRGDIDAGAQGQRMFTLKDMVVDVRLATSAADGFDIQADLLGVDIQDSGIHFVTESADPWFYCNYPECSDGLPPQCGECYIVCGAAGFAGDVSNFFVEWFDQVIARLTVILVNTVLDQVEVVSGKLHPALLLGGALPETYDAAMLRFGLRPARSGGSFRVAPLVGDPDGGGDLGALLALGLEPDAVHPCVAPLGEGPSFKPPSSLGSLLVDPLATPRPELALTASAALVNHALWALYGSGALCLDVDTDLVKRLTQGQLDLSADTLSLLLPGLERVAEPGSPLLLSLRPNIKATDFPLVRFGSGDATRPGESLIEVALPSTVVGIYGRVDGHFVRLLEVSASLRLGVTPLIMPDASLSLGVDHVSVDGLEVRDDRLFKSVQTDRLLSYVTELLTNVLLVQDFSLPLPLDALVQQVLGIPLSLRFGEFQRLGQGLDWLSLQVGVSAAGAGTGSLQAMAQTALAKPSEGARQVIEVIEVTERASLIVSLDVPEHTPAIEAQHRIDGLAWSGFQPGPDVAIRSHLLSLPGEHVVEVRARYQGDFKSLDITPLSLSVVTAAAPLVAAATDPAPSSVSAPSDPGSGCQAAPRAPAHPGYAGLAAALSLFVGAWAASRRRRAGQANTVSRANAVSAAALCALCVLSGCDDEVAAQRVACVTEGDCASGQHCACDGFCAYPLRCTTSAECCGGRACVDGLCESRAECRLDDDCAKGMRCDGCQCVHPTPLPAQTLPCAGQCDEQEVCIAARGVCIERAGICPDAACAPGQVLILTGEAGILGDQCSYEGLGCACEQAPALQDPSPGGALAVALEAPGAYHVAAYERALGDLLWLTADASLDLSAAAFVDGVPEGVRPVADPLGPRGGVALPGPDVGRAASAAFTSAGVLAISSYDATNGALRLAVRHSPSAEWRAFTIDDDADSGRDTSIAALSDGRLVIAYQARDLNPAGQGVTALKVAIARTAKPASAADFIIRTVDEAPVDPDGLPCGGLCQGASVCWADDQTCAPPTSDCRTACFADSACRFGVCAPTLRALRPPHHDAVGTGVDPHIIAQNQSVWIVFYQAHLGRLALADGAAGGPYTLTTLDEGTNRAGFGFTDAGRHPRAALDPDGTLHVAYLDDIQGSLRYLAFDTATREVTAREEVDPGAASNPPRLIGGLDIGLRGHTPAVAYHDASAGALIGARRQPDTSWLPQVLTVQDVSGLSPALLMDGNKALVLSGRLSPSPDGSFTESIRLIQWP
jgi:hypothetical protein